MSSIHFAYFLVFAVVVVVVVVATVVVVVDVDAIVVDIDAAAAVVEGPYAFFFPVNDFKFKKYFQNL